MSELMNVPDFLKRAAEKTGFRRERFIERNIPTAFDNIVIMLFYGDMRAESILSSLLLHRYKESYPGKYFILASFPGHGSLYPYIDEYWGCADEGSVKILLDSAVGFGNLARERILFQEQQLNRFFANMFNIAEYTQFYDNGFTKDFFDKFKWILYNLPSLPSAGMEFNRSLAHRSGYKIFVHPTKMLRAWDKGKETLIRSRPEFWYDLANRMISRGMVPVVYQDARAFDLSKEMQSKCIYITEPQVSEVMGMMRATGCILDVFSGLARWASIARTPYISCAERKRYNLVKDWEIDDLCNSKLPYRYIFSFPTIIESGNWNELVESIVNKLESFVPQLNRDSWPSTAEQSIVVPYGLVKKRKTKRIGTRFIKIPKMEY